MKRFLILLPYCPLPIDSGAKVEMWKHLHILKGLGHCILVSARRRPVGYGWTSAYEQELQQQGFELVFREDAVGLGLLGRAGLLFGAMCKILRLERAFGHSNLYHRYAFPASWWHHLSQSADVAVINYSYWAYLPTACPKVVVTHDLISTVSYEGFQRETQELNSAQLVVMISQDEEQRVQERGVRQTLWSPPLIESMDLPLPAQVGMVGSANRFNQEGLAWLAPQVAKKTDMIRVYGSLARYTQKRAGFLSCGPYDDSSQPYRECGIIVLSTAGGTGVQIKAVEALAAGRAIIARKGAMRGLPPDDRAWIEVEDAREMVDWCERLLRDHTLRIHMATGAKDFYHRHLAAEQLRHRLHHAYIECAERPVFASPEN